ncbi:MAG: metal ABC transporter ATP-binding protein [Lachnospiraceae bacterium]|nr:metal ABC transporter ATP-binding protein [Lachnospiraceae bacterium]
MEQREKECLLTCVDAGLGYENKAILEHFDFRVHSGEYVCVVGENGSGKSTLIRTLLGLIKPVSGRVELAGELHGEAIGYLPQQTQVQKHFPASVMEVVLSGFQSRMKSRPFHNRTEKKEALRNLGRLEIADLKNKCYGDLSGGQQQRVLLARALCATEQLLVLDEPVTGLDPTAAASLYDNLDKLHEEGVAIIMVTHDIANAVRHADYILHIGEGDYFYGSVETYLDSEYSRMFEG